MARKLKILFWVALVAGAGYGGWTVYQRFFAAQSGTERLVNQVWVERMARDDRDPIHHLVLLDGRRGRAGVIGRSSRWRVLADVFLWRLDGNVIHTRFPQFDRRMAFRVRTWRCSGEAPRPFELCLEIQRDGRSARFYSRNEWVVSPGGSVADEQLAALMPSLDALGRTPADGDAALEGPEAPADAWPF